MPYAIVETVGALNGDGLLVVPETWLVYKTEAIAFLHWPDTKQIPHLRELLADDQSAPPASCSKRICKIVYRNILSHTSAEKTLQVVQKHRKTMVPGTAASSGPVAFTVKGTMQKDLHSKATSTCVSGSNQPSRRVEENTLQLTNRPPQDPFRDVISSMNVVNSSNPSKQVFSKFSSTDQDRDPFEEINNAEDMQQGKSKTKLPNKPVAKNELSYKPAAGTEPLATSRNNHPDPKYDPTNCYKQLFDLILGLKSMIKANQEEMIDKLNVAVLQMQASVKSYIDQMFAGPETSEASKATQPTGKVTSQKYRLTSVEEVKRFETQLNEPGFRRELHDWVQLVVEHEEDASKRMKRVLDLMLDKKLMTKFSWIGTKTKYALRDFFNIMNLFEYVGTTAAHRVDDVEVRKFFRKHLKYAKDMKYIRNYYAKKALQAKCDKERTLAPSLDLSVEEDEEDTDAMELDEGEGVQMGQEETSNQGDVNENYNNVAKDEIVEEYEIVEQVDENVGNGTESAAEDGDGFQSVPEISVQPIETLEELIALETHLRDEKAQTEMQEWIEQTVGEVANAETRMKMLLERLLDKNFLLQFCWTNVGSGKRSLVKYTNFVRLFEYASRTVIHQTVIFNHGCVANFFAKALDHAS